MSKQMGLRYKDHQIILSLSLLHVTDFSQSHVGTFLTLPQDKKVTVISFVSQSHFGH